MFIKTQTGEPLREDGRKRERDYASLVQQLSDPDPRARRWAARDLIDSAGASALVARLKIEHEISVREVILTTLTRLGDPTAVSGLVDCLRSEDAALRNEAIEAMAQLPDEMAPIMQMLLADPDPDVRIFAVNILESLRHEEVEAWLIEVMEKDPHINVCAAAANVLCEVGTEAAFEPLAGLKTRFPNEPYIHFVVNLALKRASES